MMKYSLTRFVAPFALLITSLLTLGVAADLPRPDEKPADTSKTVKVFIIMGQSNTLEMGKVKGDNEGSLEFAVNKENLYPFMIDGEGNWTKRQDVRNVHTQGSGGPDGRGGVRRNDWLTVSGGKIGIEQGIGHQLGNYFDEPVLILKSSIGNRSLGWDLLPPGSDRYEYTESNGKTYFTRVQETPLIDGKKVLNQAQSIGTQGCNTRVMLRERKRSCRISTKPHPNATKYEVAGFLWWQGDKDRYKEGHAAMYEKTFNNLIASLRRDFEAAKAKFVCATLGQTSKEDAKGNEKMILDAMFAISDAAKYPSLKGDVATVYTNPISMGGASNGHYGGNAKTYMNVGLAMGEAMVNLFKQR